MRLLELLGLSNKSNTIAEYVAKGAVIIDVRSGNEFAAGHIQGAKNIPLDAIPGRTSEIKELQQPVIVCCRSGMRSGQAASILKQKGVDVINGGGWETLQQKL
ncbi:rhodanese-like domain-containing protein [Flavobacterium pedocola]